MPNPEPGHLRRQREARALDPETDAPIPRQFLRGKLTAVCLLISGLGAGASLFGFSLPATEINSVLTWIAANYDGILFVGGQIGAAYGQLRRNWRREQQIKALGSL